jgi:hypothetical protein
VPSAALTAAASSLRCPNCGAPLICADRALRCASGHSFDVARQGHVALLPPGRTTAGGDSSEMVAARDAFLGAGHFAPIAAAVTTAAQMVVGTSTDSERCVVDLGAGTGYYLAALLEALPDWIASRSMPRVLHCAARPVRMPGSPRSRAMYGWSCRSRTRRPTLSSTCSRPATAPRSRASSPIGERSSW